ncbi:uncharacterized protein F4822DRAFT_77386 [Hypoxylon trugodes]|uniref:uncharacterized protein n=1 Tax=Hypoxylon trugodes TaxID=326681 RepID=UPI00219E734B|nr:uncharacterized protein F4822DRAFT_77386 [Hypoxylon trugodes]KAI1383425.1 hypothetical protein F4822DRAFT_77386 [Hypoxylon trugodes]
MDYQDISIDATNSRPDEYARENSLSVDSQVDVFLLFAHFQEESIRESPEELTDDTSLTQLRIPSLLPRIEQLDVSKESLELLGHAVSLGRENIQAFKLPSFLDLAKLKLELPLLQSDPDHDRRELARRIQKQRSTDIDLRSVPSEPLSISNDESLEYPETTSQYKQNFLTAIKNERIDIPKDTLRYLSYALKDEWTRDKQRGLLNEALRRKPIRELAITPPLSPCAHNDEDGGYFIPDEETCQIPISSDPSTLLDADLTRAEAGLLEEDGLDPEGFSYLAVENSSISLRDLPMFEPGHPSISSLKIEGPLTPLNASSPNSDLAMDFLGFVEDMDADQILDKDLSLSDARGEKDPNGIFSDDALTVLQDQATLAGRNIEQEQLQTADALARVEIPAMDFSIPDPEWRNTPLDAASQLAWLGRKYEAFKVPPWPKNLQADRKLHWSPFPSKQGQISTNESIDENDDVIQLLSFSGSLGVLTSADYVWKQPGIAILQDPEEEEEPLEWSMRDGANHDLESLVRKRRLELEDADPKPGNSLELSSPVDLIQIPPDMVSRPRQAQLGSQGHIPSLLVGCNDSSATSTLLSNYVDFHASKRQKHTRSSFFPKSNKPTAQIEMEAAAQTATPVQSDEPLVEPKPSMEQPTTPAPYPKIEPTPMQTKIIKALTLSRGVFSRLEKLYPNAEIIERDFDRWNTLAWGRNSVAHSPVVSPLAAEADVAVSPATGIILTTLLKAIQKPLPGQKGLSAARERIRNVAIRYERIIILVSEANRVDETIRDLTPSECAAYAEFSGFITGLNSNAEVYYVGGGDETLAKWLVSFLIRYAPEAASVQDILIQEESLWELFLRRAGLNAYAAQAILGQLKSPDDMPEEESGKYGLPAFIRMTPKERVEVFRGIMGGERVLRRLNAVLEARWE